MLRLPFFAVTALVTGIALRLVWLRDIEYKGDERYVFEAVNRFLLNPLHNWDWLGMQSSQILRNPGASIWVFDVLAWLGRADHPVKLALMVVLLNCLALILGFFFVWHEMEGDEQRAWYWGLALVSVDPLSLVLSRHIWAQSVLPFFAMWTWIAWWYRKRSTSAAVLWPFLVLMMGEIHMSGFFLALGLGLWTLLFVDKMSFRWKSWIAGTALAALPLVPWFLQLLEFSHHPGSAFRWYRVFMMKFWNYWLSNPTGLVMQYSLGKDFEDFVRWPWVQGYPTYGVLLAQLTLLVVVLGGTFAIRHSPSKLKKRGWKFFTDAGDSTGQLLNAALWGYGTLISLSMIFIERHYLLVVFPLVHVWVARFFHTSDRWLAAAWGAQLFVSAVFLFYVHAHGGVPHGDYGIAPFH